MILLLINLSVIILLVDGQITIPPPPTKHAPTGPNLPEPPGCLQTTLPEDYNEWKISTSTINVEWSYNRGICMDYNSCFQQNETKPENNVAMVAQLLPLQIQFGEPLSFHLGRVDSVSVASSMQPFKVSEENFKSCDINGGVPIIPVATSEKFIVNPQYLAPGNNYFIGSTSDPILQCDYGLRINITVKQHFCVSPGNGIDRTKSSAWCWGKGRCLTTFQKSNYSCECCHGFSNTYCDDVDACADQPCQNGATCHDLHNIDPKAKICECYQGFTGALCETAVNDLCLVANCQNDATCVGNQTHFECHCTPGFTGPKCEQNINDCTETICGQGICIDGINNYTCYCPPGREGRNCEIMLNACESTPCQNGGYCVDEPGSRWRCHCNIGYSGPTCSTPLDLCANHHCINAEECANYGNTIECICKPGFTGHRCEININECNSHPCQHGGTCQDGVGTYTCLCVKGFEGHQCQHIAFSPDMEWDQTGRHVDNNYEDTPEEEKLYNRLHNMYIAAGTLGGAIFIALSVIAVCYCKYYGIENIFPFTQFKHRLLEEDSTDASAKNEENNKSTSRSKQVASISGTSHLSPEAIQDVSNTRGAHGETTMKSPLMNSLKSKKV